MIPKSQICVTIFDIKKHGVAMSSLLEFGWQQHDPCRFATGKDVGSLANCQFANGKKWNSKPSSSGNG